jgi:hypothetical protein
MNDRVVHKLSALLLWGALLAVAAPVAAQTTCRPNNLGTVSCPVGPPKPRPVLEADTQALDRVRREPGVVSKAPVFVPARRTNRLGGATELAPGDPPVSYCRPDRLGNLQCR